MAEKDSSGGSGAGRGAGDRALQGEVGGCCVTSKGRVLVWIRGWLVERVAWRRQEGHWKKGDGRNSVARVAGVVPIAESADRVMVEGRTVGEGGKLQWGGR